MKNPRRAYKVTDILLVEDSAKDIRPVKEAFYYPIVLSDCTWAQTSQSCLELGAFLLTLLMYFCPGEPMHFCSGVDILARYPHNESVVGNYFKASISALGGRDSGAARFIGAMESKDRILAAHRLAHYPCSHVISPYSVRQFVASTPASF